MRSTNSGCLPIWYMWLRDHDLPSSRSQFTRFRSPLNEPRSPFNADALARYCEFGLACLARSDRRALPNRLNA